MSLDPNAPAITTFSNADLFEIYSEKTLKKANYLTLANSLQNSFDIAVFPMVNVRDYGAIGNGVVDDTVAIQNAVNAVIGNNVANGAVATRIANSSLWFPSGNYLISSPIKIYSVIYFHMFAYGARFLTNTALDMMFDLNGAKYCTINGGNYKPTGVVNEVIKCYWDQTTAATSSSKVCIRDVRIEGNYTTGIRFGDDGDNNQSDHMILENCWLAGAWVSGEETLGQKGVHFGSGVGANNLNHSVFGLVCTGHKNHVYIAATNVRMFGADFDRSQTDIFLGGSLTLIGCRSEEAEAFLDTSGPSTANFRMCFQDINFNGDDITGNNWIYIKQSGELILDNVCITNPNASFTPKIRLNAGNATSVKRLMCNIRNLLVDNTTATLAGSFTIDAPDKVDITIQGFHREHSSGGNELLNNFAIMDSTGAFRQIVVNTDGTVSNTLVS